MYSLPSTYSFQFKQSKVYLKKEEFTINITAVWKYMYSLNFFKKIRWEKKNNPCEYGKNNDSKDANLISTEIKKNVVI